jgi:prevent-host-death family protein
MSQVFMRQINSTDFKTHFGDFVDLVRDEPIEVLRGSKPVGVFLSRDEYQHLQAIEDAYWGAIGEAAVARGDFLTPAEVMRWVNQRLSKDA